MTTVQRPVKVIIAKAGLDGHERGAHAVTSALRDAGMDVVYLGMFQTPERIAEAVLQEDAEVVGLSSLNGEHIRFTRRVLEALHDRGLGDVLLIVGGIVPAEDVPQLREMGVTGVFPPGSPMREIVAFITGHALTGDGRGRDG
jgi:methylmalonyl-CoA mutase C-terminal domain/subunit